MGQRHAYPLEQPLVCSLIRGRLRGFAEPHRRIARPIIVPNAYVENGVFLVAPAKLLVCG